MSDRVIKFRQVISNKDGTFKEFHYWGYIQESLCGLCCALPLGPTDWDKRPSEQFTTLLDKNGKEIYQGDRCRQRNGRWSAVGVVTFTNGIYYLTFENRQMELYIAIDDDELEIIGTVHDTQEAK